MAFELHSPVGAAFQMEARLLDDAHPDAALILTVHETPSGSEANAWVRYRGEFQRVLDSQLLLRGRPSFSHLEEELMLLARAPLPAQPVIGSILWSAALRRLHQAINAQLLAEEDGDYEGCL